MAEVKVNQDVLLRSLPHILNALPTEWKGTTFANDALLGRDGFAKNISQLLVKGPPISTADLTKAGTAEDYLRVSSNVSVLLELSLAILRGISVEQVFTFSSKSMPLVSVLLTAKTPVHVFTGGKKAVLTQQLISLLEGFGCKLVIHAEATSVAVGNDVVLNVEGVKGFAHGVLGENVLYILDPHVIQPADILVIRKRMAIPITTPVALTKLQELARIPITTGISAPEKKDLADFYAHLQTLCGTAVNHASNPVIFAAGLPSLCSMYLALVSRGGADVVMCSTAYGGSSQLTDLLTQRSKSLRKHTFDIQGEQNMVVSVENTLKQVSKRIDLLAYLLLFIEIPTNPDMKVPNLARIVELAREYRKTTGRKVLMLVDTTFGPNSHVLGQIQALDADLPALVFISMSKHLSKGHTTAGTLIANHTKEAQDVLSAARQIAAALDTNATTDQLQILCKNHVEVESRSLQAYETARAAADALCKAVYTYCGVEMPLHFVTAEQAKAGFTTPTFSFNLPSPKGATQEINEALAQRFVDELCVNKSFFKPCVSFGQDNGLVYATVPATSTQGALKAEDKAKQALGGVQLVRLSFPPTCDRQQMLSIISNAVRTMYSGQKSAL